MTTASDHTRPIYSLKAKIENARELYARLSVSYDAIASQAACHTNTVRNAIASKSMQYQKAHDVFTALNQMLHNQYSRYDHVLYEESPGEFRQDPALKRVFVIPGLRTLLRDHRVSNSDLVKASGVDILTVDEAVKKRPTPEAFAIQIAEGLVKLGIPFDKDIGLIR